MNAALPHHFGETLSMILKAGAKAQNGLALQRRLADYLARLGPAEAVPA
jgi:hypothetical protein